MVRRVGSSVDQRASKRANHGEWLVNVADDVVVPMTTLEVIDALRKGRLSEQSLVWRVGMHDWSAVLDVPQLRLAASSRPPPAFFEPAVEPSAELPALATAASVVESAAAPIVEPPLESTESAELSAAVSSAMPSSLAPTTAEAEAAAPVRAPNQWGDLDALLSSEQRADERNSRRVVVWAALGAAALAAAFTLFVVRSPAPSPAEPAAAAEPSHSPAPTATAEPVPAAPIEALAAPSASVLGRPPTAPRTAPKWSAPRFARRPKRAVPISAASEPASAAAPATPAPETNDAPGMAVVPAAPLETTATPSTPSAAPPVPVPVSPPNGQ